MSLALWYSKATQSLFYQSVMWIWAAASHQFLMLADHLPLYTGWKTTSLCFHSPSPMIMQQAPPTSVALSGLTVPLSLSDAAVSSMLAATCAHSPHRNSLQNKEPPCLFCPCTLWYLQFTPSSSPSQLNLSGPKLSYWVESGLNTGYTKICNKRPFL